MNTSNENFELLYDNKNLLLPLFYYEDDFGFSYSHQYIEENYDDNGKILFSFINSKRPLYAIDDEKTIKKEDFVKKAKEYLSNYNEIAKSIDEAFEFGNTIGGVYGLLLQTYSIDTDELNKIFLDFGYDAYIDNIFNYRIEVVPFTDDIIIDIHRKINYDNINNNYDSNGNKIAKGMQDYLKNTKVRDTQGRPYNVYHTTNGYADFIEFLKSDSKVLSGYDSFYFTNNLLMSSTYTRFKKKVANPEIAEFDYEKQELKNKTAGTFSGYLNITNPLIVDAKGADWNNIEYGIERNAKELKDELRTKLNPNKNKTISKEFLIDFIYELSNNKDFYKTIDMLYSTIDSFNSIEIYKPTTKQELKNELKDFALDGYTILSIDGEEFNVYGKNEKDFLDDFLSIYADNYVDDYVSTRDIENYAHKKGYDGVIIYNVVDYGSSIWGREGLPSGDVYITFNSNQFKEIKNQKPTESPNILKSQEIDAVMQRIIENNSAKPEELNTAEKKEKAKELRKKNRILFGQQFTNDQAPIVAEVVKSATNAKERMALQEQADIASNTARSYKNVVESILTNPLVKITSTPASLYTFNSYLSSAKSSLLKQRRIGIFCCLK